jgi:hypothetical protein
MSSKAAWLFPAILAGAILVSTLAVSWTLGLKDAPLGAELSGRLTWSVAALLFAVLFVFAVVVCNTLMFSCGAPGDAIRGLVGTSLVGVLAVLLSMFNSHAYLGPSVMKELLETTAFKLQGVRALSAFFDGCACWAAGLVIVTSSVILRNEVDEPEALSRQLRGSRILMHTMAALLIAGVAETGALHKWPAHDPAALAAFNAIHTKTDAATVESAATSISTTVGTVFTLVLAAGYMPLGVVLRQRAYRIVVPWERAETWLAVHGFALLPAQQLAKVLLIFSPLLAGGPVSYLITLLSGLPGR